MESGGPCEFEMEIFNKMLIPIPICNTDMGYKIPRKYLCPQLWRTCDNLPVTKLEIPLSFPGDCVLLPGDYSTSLTHHFDFFFQ